MWIYLAVKWNGNGAYFCDQRAIWPVFLNLKVKVPPRQLLRQSRVRDRKIRIRHSPSLYTSLILVIVAVVKNR